MNKWTKFGIVVGTIIGIVMKILVWAAAIWGFVMSILNHEVPYLPAILLFTYYIFIGMLRVQAYVNAGILSIQVERKKQEDDISRLANLISLMGLYRGGNQ